jgi:hypothetical protein
VAIFVKTIHFNREKVKRGLYLRMWTTQRMVDIFGCFGSALNYPKNGQHADFPGCVVYESKEYTPYIYMYIDVYMYIIYIHYVYTQITHRLSIINHNYY